MQMEKIHAVGQILPPFDMARLEDGENPWCRSTLPLFGKTGSLADGEQEETLHLEPWLDSNNSLNKLWELQLSLVKK